MSIVQASNELPTIPGQLIVANRIPEGKSRKSPNILGLIELAVGITADYTDQDEDKAKKYEERTGINPAEQLYRLQSDRRRRQETKALRRGNYIPDEGKPENPVWLIDTKLNGTRLFLARRGLILSLVVERPCTPFDLYWREHNRKWDLRLLKPSEESSRNLFPSINVKGGPIMCLPKTPADMRQPVIDDLPYGNHTFVDIEKAMIGGQEYLGNITPN